MGWALSDGKALYASLFREASDAILVYNLQDEILDANKRALSLFGYTRDELLGMSLQDLQAPEQRSVPGDGIEGEIVSHGEGPFEAVDLTKDGRRIAVEVTNTVSATGGERIVFSIIRDITERKTRDREAQEDRALLRSIMNSPPDILILSVDREYRYTFFNNAHRKGMLDVWGTEPRLGVNVLDLIPDEEYREQVRYYYDKAFQGEIWSRLSSFTDLHGNIRYFDNLSAPVKDADGNIIGLTVFITEVTDRVKSEKKLQESLQEKEILLREVHHRVKNNLQIVSSLLNMQILAHDDNRIVMDQLMESQNRIVTMALIHEHLYESDSLARIDIGDYLKELVEVILRSYSVHPEAITVEYDLEELSLGIETSIPLGLIVNELINNSVKYAFPEENQGIIRIMFRTEGEESGAYAVFEVADNGVGCDDSLVEPGKRTGLGLQIVEALTDQLRGEFTIHGKGGVCSRIRFPLPADKESIAG